MALFDRLFFGFAILVLGVFLLVVLPRLSRGMKKRVEAARAALAARGYVVEASLYKPVGDMTRIWGRLAAPSPLYLQVSSLDPVAVLAGAAGVADLKVGDPRFDAAFVVRSNAPEVARAILDATTRQRLLAHRQIRFRTGSIDSLLGADYFPENRSGRDTREWWMIEVAGKPAEVDASSPLALARDLAEAVNAAITSVPPAAGLRTGFFEGR